MARRSWSTPCRLVLKNLKDVGIDAKLDQKEYGAYIASCFYGKFDSMTYGPQTPFLEPDNFLYGQYYPGEPKNQSHINDPVVADMLVRQRRTFDVAKRRELIYEIQRYLAKQQYYVQTPSGVYVAVWEGALKNYGAQRGLRLRRPPAWPPGSIARRPQLLRRYVAKRLLDRDPVAADRVAHRLHAAAADPRRRRPAHAGGEGLRQGHRRAARAKLGLDRPIYVQYFEWAGRAVRGDLGESLWTRRPVIEEIGRRLPVTLQLACHGHHLRAGHRDPGGRDLGGAAGHAGATTWPAAPPSSACRSPASGWPR